MGVKHKEKFRHKYMHSGDCYLYEIVCVCGEKSGGWTPSEAEAEFDKHMRGDA